MAHTPDWRRTTRKKFEGIHRLKRWRPDMRRLRAEPLERRWLLTAVTGVAPLANSHDAPTATDVAATFDEAIVAASATPQSFVVRSELRPGTAAVSVSGMTVTADPSVDFFAGERVHVTATSGLQGTATANTARVWQFRVGASAGSGQFVDSGQIIGPNDPTRADRVAFGDIDGDGDLDTFAGTRFWINDGNGVFTESGQAITVGGEEIVFGDVDGDSDLDLIGQSDVFVNDGSGVFSPGADLSGNRTAYNTAGAAGDLDGDGDLDIMQGNTYGANRVFFNDGSGNFTDSGQSLTTSGGTDSIKLADFDGDGDLDALEAVNGAANRIWINDGAGVFAGVSTIGGFDGTKDIDVGDVDGDGDVDLLLVNNDEGGDQSVRIWTNDGAGIFTNSGQSLNNGAANWAGEFADVDADGDLDIVFADRIDRTLVFMNDGSGVFADSGQSLTFGQPNVTRRIFGLGLGDVDGDGDLDLWEANQSSGGNRLWINQNLQPSVSLAIDNATIAEDAGAATVTATLSAAHTVAVTVDLGFSGTATVDTDYTTSGAQIVIAAGATSGSVAITAIQDAVDDDDETVIVDITGTTNADEAGTQQVTTTIVDDDEPAPVPDVTLAVDNAAIPEEAGVATFTATLSLVTTVPVTVDLGLSGSAAASDYTVSGTQIVIAPGATSGSVTVTAVQDTEDEPDETVVVDITSVTGGTESGTQQQTTTITDDDEVVVGMTVTTLTATATGFIAEFANELDAAELNLYDTQTAGLGAADVLLSGAASGPITGSLVVAARSIEFIKSGSPLAGDTYTVTLRSAADGIKDTGGLLLDGNGDGTAGDDFSSTFEVAAPAANSVTVSIPDVVRGPGQAVNLPADSTSGIPLTISEGTNVRAIDVRIAFDPTLISIEAATPGPDAPAGASVVLNNSTPGLAIVVYFASAPLPAGSGVFVNLQASVPEANASENYRRHQVLDLHDVVVSDGNDNESPAIADDGLHVATFFGDVSANGRINAADAAQVARIAALLDSGFANTPSTDPGLLGDISGNSRLNAADASLVAQFAALITVPQIPPLPGGVVISGFPSLPAAVQVDPEQDDRLVSPLALGFTDRATWMAEEIGEDVLSERADNLSSHDAFFAELMDEVVTDGLSDHPSQ